MILGIIKTVVLNWALRVLVGKAATTVTKIAGTYADENISSEQKREKAKGDLDALLVDVKDSAKNAALEIAVSLLKSK